MAVLAVLTVLTVLSILTVLTVYWQYHQLLPLLSILSILTILAPVLCLFSPQPSAPSPPTPPTSENGTKNTQGGLSQGIWAGLAWHGLFSNAMLCVTSLHGFNFMVISQWLNDNLPKLCTSWVGYGTCAYSPCDSSLKLHHEPCTKPEQWCNGPEGPTSSFIHGTACLTVSLPTFKSRRSAYPNECAKAGCQQYCLATLLMNTPSPASRRCFQRLDEALFSAGVLSFENSKSRAAPDKHTQTHKHINTHTHTQWLYTPQ